MRSKRAAALAWIALLALPAGALLPAASGAPEPQAFALPFVYRTMEGLETKLVQPNVTYDHLHDVAWAPDGHMALAVGSHNTLVGWDPLENTARILRNGTLGNLYGVAWSDDSQVALAVGWNGALVEMTPGAITTLAPEGSTTWQAAAFVPGHGFLVVGDGGAMFFLNGSTRTPVASPTTSDLLGVAYSAFLGEALAVGRAGAAVRVTPSGVATNVTSPSVEDLRAVGFESDTGVGFVAGGQGVYLRYSGGGLTNETHAAVDGGFYDLSVTSSAEPAVIAARNNTVGNLLFTNGSFSNTVPFTGSLTGVEAVARSPTQGYVLGTGFFGFFVQAWQNGSVVNHSTAFRPVITDASWRPAGDLALLVGFNGTVTFYNRSSTEVTLIAGPNTTASLRGVSWSQDGSYALIVGAYSIWRFNVSGMNITQPVAGPPDLYGVAFRPGGTDAVLVGAGGYVGRWDGSSLTQVGSSVVQGLFTVKWHTVAGVGDYAYAAGANIVARFDPPSTVAGVVRIGTFFGVAFTGDDVWAVGATHQIQHYTASQGIWDNVSLPWAYNTTRFSRVVERPDGAGLLLVGNQSFTAYLNMTKVLRFDTGFFADFNGVEYNPVTRDPLFWGAGHLAFSLHEGSFPNLPPIVRLTGVADGTNWTTADTLRFDASTSSDFDDDPLTFSWFDNLTGFLTNGASLTTTLGPGNHTITVFADDLHGNNVSAAVRVFVEVAQYPPIAFIDTPLSNATPSDDDIVTFSAASSYDPNGDVLTYRWNSSVLGIFSNASITALKLPAGTHLITLTVTDTTGRSANATMVLVVHVGNQPPSPTVVSPSATGSYASNIPILLNASGTADPDSPALSYKWLASDGLTTWELARGAVNQTFLQPGHYDITLVVDDGQKSATLTVGIDVGPPADLPPRILTILPANGTVLSNVTEFNGTVDVDPVGPVLYVEVRIGDDPNWRRASGTVVWTISLDTREYVNGAVVVLFRAADGRGTAVEARTYTIDNPFINAPPTIGILTPRSGANLEVTTEMAGSLDDPDSSSVTVEYRLDGGAWKPANVTGTTWSITLDPAALPAGPVFVEVRAYDGHDYSAPSGVAVVVVRGTSGGGGISDTLLALALVAIGAVAAVALAVWRRSRT